MKLGGINHLLFSVSNLEKSMKFYMEVFNAKPLLKGKSTVYFDLNGLWLALNEEKDIPRRDIHKSYTHIAFSVEEEEFDAYVNKLKKLGVTILPGRERDIRDKQSIYFIDLDGHKFEFHTGTLNDRLQYYMEAKPHLEFFN
ncbi:metallothiol transferase FosB [Paucisalibacillus globulus]|uniref:metallothiol transferase FosB n=1 Tax=Paucisalibacillus globulus TaxID=351095 RepID=UPI000BB915F8|nr:metallothiol transferase FosB [Paucisalibacillus globulus]